MKNMKPLSIALIIMAGLQMANLGLTVNMANGSGLSFGTTLNLSNDLETSDTPRIASAGPNVYVAWQNSTLDTNPNILFTAGTDNGTSFGPIISLSNPASAAADQQIAAAGSYVYVAWVDNSTGNYDIYFATSIDNGTSFGSIVNLSNDAGVSTTPRMAVAGTDVYLAWQNEDPASPGSVDIFFAASLDAGANFGSVQNLSADATATSPELAASGSNVYVAWQDLVGGRFDLFLRASTDNGASFGSAINLSNNPASPETIALSQRLVAAGSNVYVVWESFTFTSSDVAFTKSLNNGAPGSFGSPVALTSNGASTNPQAAAAGAYVHVVWEDHSVPGGFSIISYARSVNEGANFGNAVQMSSATGFSTSPQVAAAGTGVYVAWEDSTLNSDVFFAGSGDNGASFATQVNLSDNGGFSTSPSLAAGTNGTAYVAWQDDTPGDLDILFRAGSAKGPPTPDTTPPSWPVGTILTTSNIGPTGLRLSWSAATDNVGVALYRVYQGANVLVTLDSSIRAYDVAGLTPGTMYAFKVEASDAADNWSTDGPSTTATTTTVGHAPVLDPIGGKTVDEEMTLAFTATASDADGDQLAFSLGPTHPAGASITSGGVFSWTPSEAQGPGSYSVTVVVSDGSLTDSKTFTVTVREVNRPPVLSPVGAKSVARGASLSFRMNASDPDLPGQTLTFSLATGLFPQGATITSDGIFSWTPSSDLTPGNYTVRVTVSDGGASDSEQFTVIVSDGQQQGPLLPSWTPWAIIGLVVVLTASLLVWVRWKRKA